MGRAVLLVEDFPIIQNLYGDSLRRHGFNVDTAQDGSVALEKTTQKEYDFILLDLLLPKVNGIEFLEKFVNRPKQTKIFVLSDFDEEKTVQRAHELGIEAYLIKAENTPSQLIKKLIGYQKQA